jgi:hypothetical protein
LRELAEAGHITRTLTGAGLSLAKNNLIELLSETGNAVYILTHDEQAIKVKNARDLSETSIDANDKWSLAELIVSQVTGTEEK